MSSCGAASFQGHSLFDQISPSGGQKEAQQLNKQAMGKVVFGFLPLQTIS